MDTPSTGKSFIFPLWLGFQKTGFQGTRHYSFRRQPPRWLVRIAILRGWGITLRPISDESLKESAHLTWEPAPNPKVFLVEQLARLSEFSKSLRSLEIEAKSLTLPPEALEKYIGLKSLGLNCKLNSTMDFQKFGELELLSCFDPSLFRVKSLRSSRQIRHLGCVGYRQELSQALPDSIVTLQLIRGLPPVGLSLKRFINLRHLALEAMPLIDLQQLEDVGSIEELRLSKFEKLLNFQESLRKWTNLKVIQLDGAGYPWQIAQEIRAAVPAGIRVSINGREL